MGGDADDANDLIRVLCIEPKIEILAAASISVPDLLLYELGKHADTTNIFIGIGDIGA